jgi:hypothetical protein
MFENNVLKKIFGHKKEQVTAGIDRHVTEEMHRTFPRKSKRDLRHKLENNIIY